MQEVIGVVLGSKKISPDTYTLNIQAPQVALQAQPGQFINVKCGNDKSYVLRRPLSVHRVQGGAVELFFKVKGKGTAWLSHRKKKDEINLLGPLGNGFILPKKGQTVMLVAGGMGIAPMMFLADELVKKHCKFVFAYGAKCKEELHFFIDVKRISHRMICSTEDGSYGITGLITQALPEVVQQENVSLMYACGPRPMLAALGKICLESEIAGQVALEERMACGIGACLSCVCVTKTEKTMEYKRVCIDGPVFDFDQVVWP